VRGRAGILADARAASDRQPGRDQRRSGVGQTPRSAATRLHFRHRLRHPAGTAHPQCTSEGDMKGMDQKKNTKKAPTKTLKEKRAAKQEKKK